MPARGIECECGIIRTYTQAGQSLPECEKHYSSIWKHRTWFLKIRSSVSFYIVCEKSFTRWLWSTRTISVLHFRFEIVHLYYLHNFVIFILCEFHLISTNMGLDLAKWVVSRSGTNDDISIFHIHFYCHIISLLSNHEMVWHRYIYIL